MLILLTMLEKLMIDSQPIDMADLFYDTILCDVSHWDAQRRVGIEGIVQEWPSWWKDLMMMMMLEDLIVLGERYS